MLKNLITFALLISFAITALSAADSKQKVLFVLTNHGQMGDTGERTGFYLSELTHPYYVIQDAGYVIDLASPLGGPAPIDPKSLDKSDAKNQRFYKDAQLLSAVQTTQKLANVDISAYSAIVFSGGHGTMWDLPRNESVQSAIAAVYEAGGVVAAVCHGPAALVDVKLSDGSYLVNGKRIAVFTDEEERIVKLENVVPFLLQSKLIEQGGIDASAKPWQEAAIADQRLITGQNPQSATKLGHLIIRELQKIQK